MNTQPTTFARVGEASEGVVPRFAAQPGDPVYTDRPEITSPDAAADILADHLAGSDREVCVMAALDTKHRLIEVELVSVGSVDHTFMSPRDIYRIALHHNATAIVVAHNHPSGDSKPSPDDLIVTKRLDEAGEVVGVNLLDHLVFGEYGRWVSLARRGVV